MKKRINNNFRCGMVSIVGRPNVGKSTLLNNLIGEKIAIVSRVPQTTRNQVRGIYNDERGQIVFIDTPGLRMIHDSLDRFMNKSAYGTTHDADCIIHLVDTKEPVGREEEQIVSRLSNLKVPVVLCLNKVDFKGTPYLPEYISLWERVKGKTVHEMKSFTLIPISGKKGINTDKLLDILFDYLPEGQALYPLDTVSDIPQRMAISDIIREKLFNIMTHEIPHSIAVIIEDIQPERKKLLHIRALIIVETESQKKIVIGKGGVILKKVGSWSRVELEQLLGSKVFLELHVKDRKKWRDNNSFLEEMGYVHL